MIYWIYTFVDGLHITLCDTLSQSWRATGVQRTRKIGALKEFNKFVEHTSGWALTRARAHIFPLSFRDPPEIFNIAAEYRHGLHRFFRRGQVNNYLADRHLPLLNIVRCPSVSRSLQERRPPLLQSKPATEEP